MQRCGGSEGVAFVMLFVYLGLPWVFTAVCELSLVERSRSYSLVVVCGASHFSGFPCCEARLWGHGLSSVAPGIWSSGSIVAAHELSCSVACGIFLDQGSIPCLPHRQADPLLLGHQRSPIF